jgi:hypothetical protein
VSEPKAPRPTLAQSLAVFIPGIVLTAVSAGRVVDGFTSTGVTPSLGPLLALCVGALLFCVGMMMTLVALARPLFGKRPQDEPRPPEGR